MATSDVKSRIVSKGNAHDIIMSKIKGIYKYDTLNVRELARLCNIEYYRLRRLLFDEKSDWSAEEWFRVLVVCGADGAIPQMYRSTERDLAKYQQSKAFTKSAPKTPGPAKGWKEKVEVVD